MLDEQLAMGKVHGIVINFYGEELWGEVSQNFQSKHSS